MQYTLIIPRNEMALPELQGFAGGDFMAGHYVEASGFGMALSFWGTIFIRLLKSDGGWANALRSFSIHRALRSLWVLTRR